MADHIGQFPLVMISPNDTFIIMDGSEERRKFVDNVISQTDNQYLDILIAYNRLLLHRNTVLKNIRETGVFDQRPVGGVEPSIGRSRGKNLREKAKVYGRISS
ncbi:recombination protein F [Sphingobacterium daejeonense]|nr:recombination protein F [Sphingobacterium daejeonense]